MLAFGCHAKSAPVFRYLFLDARPQRSGREVFATCERDVPVTAVEGRQGMADVGAIAMVDRRLPICGVGQGRATLPDKVA
eukprot:4737450-Lingulodinium_polyedra.AAC.1